MTPRIDSFARVSTFALSVAAFVGAASIYGCSVSNPTPTEASTTGSPTIAASPALHAAGDASIADVVEGVLPSVVSVTSIKKAPAQRSPMDLFLGRQGGGRPQSGLGSGVILSADGIVITNNHVIEGADTVKVQTVDEREYEAKVIGTDPKSDLAVLQLQGDVEELIPIRVGDSSALRLGDVVLAVGHPFGVGQTVTMGIVSATGRSDMGIVDYENFIQTDAAINPGNSGGALINMRGELVGINTAILSRSGGSMGIGFAIPTDMAGPIVEQLQTDGQVTRGFLGVRIQDLNSDLKEALGLGNQDGILIADVQKDGPAQDAGLKSGDVVIKVDDTDVTSTGHFRNLIASSKASSKVRLELIRDGKRKSLKVKLGELPSEGPEFNGGENEQSATAELDGMKLSTLDENLRRRLDVSSNVKGAVIARVAPQSKAARARLRPGDIIVEVNRRPVENAKQAEKAYQATSGAKLLKILRRGSHSYVVIR